MRYHTSKLKDLSRFRYHLHVPSKYLPLSRTVVVYLPPGYDQQPQQRYPVLYMHDGNNLFDPQTAFMGRAWKLDKTVDALFKSEKIPPIIIVGIYNTAARFDEYTWYLTLAPEGMVGGQGPRYSHFIVKELKPLIDKTYRTLREREHTAIMGSSLGALISFYTAISYPRVFSQIGMMSPTLYWANHQIMADLEHFHGDFRLWVDIGTEEGRDPETEETVESTLLFVHKLLTKGYRIPHPLGFEIDWGAGHDEWAWGKRVKKPLQYFFGHSPSLLS